MGRNGSGGAGAGVSDPDPTTGPAAAPLAYASLPPDSLLQLREDAEGLTVHIPPEPFREAILRAVVASAIFAVALPLGLLVAGIVFAVFRGWMQLGLWPWQAVARLSRLPLRLWLQPFQILGKGSLLIAGVFLVISVVAWSSSARRTRAVSLTRSGRIVYRLNEQDADPLWAVDANDVVRVKRRGRTVWLHCRNRSRHRVEGRAVDARWLAAAIERFFRQHTS